MEFKEKQQKMLSGKIGYPFFVLLFFLFFFFQLTGRDMAEKGNILWTGSYTLGVMGKSAALGGVSGILVCTLFYKYAVVMKEREKISVLQENGVRNGRKSRLIKTCVYFAGIFLCWIPGYLAYFPGICAYDTPVQMGQLMEGYMIDHHPIAHTLLLGWCIRAGELLAGSVTLGVGIYTLLQMLLLAGAFTYGMMALEEFGVRKCFRIPVWIYCMIFPFQLYMSVSMTKDTVFTAFFLVQMTALIKLLYGKNAMRPASTDWIYGAASVGMILFRNNGKYAMLALLAVLLPVLFWGKKRRKLWGRLFLNSLAAFLLGNLMLSGIFALTGASQGDRREMLSLPIQQLARTMIYHGGAGALEEDDNTMSETDKALINDFILNEAYRAYRADIADPVKRHTNTYVARFRPRDFIGTWLGLLIQYPGDYINAFLGVNAGYLYVNDVSHANVNKQDPGRGRGYIQTYWDEAALNPWGLHKASKWEGLHQVMENWADANGYLKLPVLKYLFVPGVYLWLYLLLFGYLLLQKRFCMCIPLGLAAGYFLTLLLGPTVQLRYIYPMMVILPFFALLQGRKKGLAAEGAETDKKREDENV